MSPQESGNARYSRQIRFAGFGEDGQRRLRAARVAIVGCGALGSVQAEALARAGVGFLRLIDRDFVEWSNLQRQFLFDEADASEALPKAVAAARRLAQINRECALDPIVTDLTPANIGDLLEGIDLVLDGTDNFETRYVINDASVRSRVPWIYGAAVGSYGLTFTIAPSRTACLRCVYPEFPKSPQPNCETEGVLAPVTMTIAALQSAAALKILASGVESIAARMTTVNVWSGEIRQIELPARDPACPCCALHNFEFLDGSRRAPISLCGRNAVQIHSRHRPVDLQDLARRLGAITPVRANQFALRASIDDCELTVFPDGRAIIKGTTDTALARSLYTRYVGA